MRKVAWVFVALALSAIAAPVAPSGKTTVDPNAPGAEVDASAPEMDSRLDQRITYEARRKTVLVILGDLSQATGVTLKAGYSSKDWQVRDRKMNIFAKDLPLRDLMDSIARVMKFKWERSQTDGLYSYRLYMDRKTLLDAEAQKARSEARILAKLAQRRQELLEGFENADSLSEQDLAGMKKERPDLYQMVSTGLAGGLGTLCREIPGLAEALATGQELVVSGSQLSAAGEEAVLQVLQGSSNGSATGFSEDVAKMTMQVNGSQDPMTLAEFIFMSGNQRYGVSFSETDIPAGILGDLRAKLSADIEDAKPGLEDPDRTVRDDAAAKIAEVARVVQALDMEGFDPGEPLIEHPDDPVLSKKIRLEPKSSLLQDVQCALTESSGLAVVSDCFGKTEAYGSASRDEAEIRTLLDRITKPCLYNWDRHGPVIEFRDRHWFKKRSAQIPESWIEVWRQAFKKNRTLDIAELAQIAELTPEQFNMNIKEDEVLSSAPASDYYSTLTTLVMFQQDLLRAYTALTQSERDRLFSSSGLDFAEIPSDRRAVMEKPIARRNAAFLVNPDAQITLSASRAPKGRQSEYTFTATISDNLDPIVWKLTTPKYEPPTKKRPDGKPAAEQPR